MNFEVVLGELHYFGYGDDGEGAAVGGGLVIFSNSYGIEHLELAVKSGM